MWYHKDHETRSSEQIEHEECLMGEERERGRGRERSVKSLWVKNAIVCSHKNGNLCCIVPVKSRRLQSMKRAITAQFIENGQRSSPEYKHFLQNFSPYIS